MVCIRSEHAIGFLKGRFHSLKHLRLRISDEQSHKFATYWIAACIGVHAFAMQCEDEERRMWIPILRPFHAEGFHRHHQTLNPLRSTPRKSASVDFMLLKPSVRSLSELSFVQRAKAM